MKRCLSVMVAALLITGLSAAPASAKHRRHHMRHASDGMTTGLAPIPGSAALSGNNGNSGSGSNSVGHIQGGNIGAGK